MPIYFVDSSALAKRYFNENGSSWMRDVLHPSSGNQIHIVRIAGPEVLAAVYRRIRMGTVSRDAGLEAALQFRTDFGLLQEIVEVSPQLITLAMELIEKYSLRGYDAVQLAGALVVSDAGASFGLGVTLVSADEELNAAATAEGLQVENPNLHA